MKPAINELASDSSRNLESKAYRGKISILVHFYVFSARKVVFHRKRTIFGLVVEIRRKRTRNVSCQGFTIIFCVRVDILVETGCLGGSFSVSAQKHDGSVAVRNDSVTMDDHRRDNDAAVVA